MRERSRKEGDPLPRHSYNTPCPPSIPDKQPPLPPPNHCYFGSRVTAEGLADLERAAAQVRDQLETSRNALLEGGGIEGGGEFLPLFHLPTSPLPSGTHC